MWQIQWQADDVEKHHNFVSVSSDGSVRLWTLVQNELHYADLITLTKESAGEEVADDAPVTVLASGTCISFHPTQPQK